MWRIKKQAVKYGYCNGDLKIKRLIINLALRRTFTPVYTKCKNNEKKLATEIKKR